MYIITVLPLITSPWYHIKYVAEMNFITIYNQCITIHKSKEREVGVISTLLIKFSQEICISLSSYLGATLYIGWCGTQLIIHWKIKYIITYGPLSLPPFCGWCHSRNPLTIACYLLVIGCYILAIQATLASCLWKFSWILANSQMCMQKIYIGVCKAHIKACIGL